MLTKIFFRIYLTIAPFGIYLRIATPFTKSSKLALSFLLLRGGAIVKKIQ